MGGVLLLVAALEYVVVPALVSARAEVSMIHDLSWPLFALAALLEAGSLASYTMLTQTLLRPGPVLTFGTQWRIDLTGFGLSRLAPGGGATASAVRARLMVERGIAPAAAVALAAVQFVWAVLGLLLVWLLGVVMAVPRTGITTTAIVLAARPRRSAVSTSTQVSGAPAHGGG